MRYSRCTSYTPGYRSNTSIIADPYPALETCILALNNLPIFGQWNDPAGDDQTHMLKECVFNERKAEP
jgi:hypothetical protein